MSLLNRFTTLIKKSADALLAPAEDPREKFTDPQHQPRHLLQQVSHALTQTQTLLQQMTGRQTVLQNRVAELEKEAREALRTQGEPLAAGREALARMILQRRQAILTEIAGITEQIQATQQEETRLLLVKQRVEAQMDALQTRQQVLAAQYSAAEANVRLTESLSGVAGTFSGMGLTLEETATRVGQMQARAAAVNDLLENGILDQDMLGGESTTGVLKGKEEDEAVEAYLAVLQREIGHSGQVGR